MVPTVFPRLGTQRTRRLPPSYSHGRSQPEAAWLMPLHSWKRFCGIIRQASRMWTAAAFKF
ncbi:unnamed protein product [Effrenium voratum]|nr:unnamed protein product [Effrenium voratum]